MVHQRPGRQRPNEPSAIPDSLDLRQSMMVVLVEDITTISRYAKGGTECDNQSRTSNDHTRRMKPDDSPPYPHYPTHAPYDVATVASAEGVSPHLSL